MSSSAAGSDSLAFSGRRIVVTGASSGIGRACAVELSRHGARVILVGRNQAGLTETRASLCGSGHDLVTLDLTDVDRVLPEITRLAESGDRLYGLCHAAGTAATQALGATTPEMIQSLMAATVIGGLELARAVTRRTVIDPEGGSLVFVSSVYGRVGVPGEIGYSASKGAITAAVRSMAVELARRRIRVNTISPGLVKTPMTDRALEALSPDQVQALVAKHPLGTGTAADVARAAVFLLSPANQWITGADLVVDGGYSAH